MVSKVEIEEKIERRKDVTERVKKLMIDRLRLDLEPAEIAEDAPLFGTGLGLDSVDVLEIVVGIEQEFGITIDDEDQQVLRSINTIVDFVLEKQEEEE